MLERLLEIRSTVVVIMSDRTLYNNKIAKDQELLEEDWEKKEILVSLLKPLKTATTVLCSDQNITITRRSLLKLQKTTCSTRGFPSWVGS